MRGHRGVGVVLLVSSACVFDPTLVHRPTDGGPGGVDVGSVDTGGMLAEAGTDSGLAGDADPADVEPGPEVGPDGGPDAGFEPPSAVALALQIPANTSTVVQLRGSDPAGRPLQFVLDVQGLRGTATLNGDRVDYTSPANFAGLDRFAYRASNGVLDSDPVFVQVRIYDNRTCGQVLTTYTGTASSGVYALDPDGDGGEAAFDAYCEMDLGGGGWMLVARSVANSAVPQFGWHEETGSARDDTAPYSLGALGRGIAFNRILAASYSTAKTINEAFSLSFDGDFERDCDNEGCRRDAWYPYAGGCATSLTFPPSMLTYAGHNRLRDHFFFRDSSGDFETGLGPGGWNTYYNACSLGGGLNGAQGMIFIRCNTAACVPAPW